MANTEHAHRKSDSQSIEDFKEEIQSEIEALVQSVRELATHIRKTSQQQGCEVVERAVDHAKAQPLKALGIACGIGVIMGFILKR